MAKKKSERSPDNRPASHATKAPTLQKRIEDMEERLELERTQAVIHAREFGGNVRRRLTSPTSLAFSASVGFVAGEVMNARSRVSHAAKKRAQKKAQPKRKSGGKSLMSVLRPLIPILHAGAMGIMSKNDEDDDSDRQYADQYGDGGQYAEQTSRDSTVYH